MKLLNEDCLAAMRNMPDAEIDMAYLDPPFFTQRKQKLKDAKGHEYSFADEWQSKAEYLQFIKERLLEVRRLLKDTGTIFLHCDSTASHYLRMLLDEVFGEKHFRSEIVWSYKRWSNSKKGLLPCHQTIFGIPRQIIISSTHFITTTLLRLMWTKFYKNEREITLGRWHTREMNRGIFC